MRYYLNEKHDQCVMLVPAVVVENPQANTSLRSDRVFPHYLSRAPLPNSLHSYPGVVVVALKDPQGCFHLFTLPERSSAALDQLELELTMMMLSGDARPDASIPVNASTYTVKRLLSRPTPPGDPDSPCHLGHPSVLLSLMAGGRGKWSFGGYEVSGLPGQPIFMQSWQRSILIGSPKAKNLARELARAFGEYRYSVSVLRRVQGYACFEVKLRRKFRNGVELYERRIAGQTVDYAVWVRGSRVLRHVSWRYLLEQLRNSARKRR